MFSQHFAPGEAQPISVVVASDRAKVVLDAAKDVPGVVRANPAGVSADGATTRVMVVGEPAPVRRTASP